MEYDLFVCKSSNKKNNVSTKCAKDIKDKEWTETVAEIADGIWQIVCWCLRVILLICLVGIVFDILHDIFGGSD